MTGKMVVPPGKLDTGELINVESNEARVYQDHIHMVQRRIKGLSKRIKESEEEQQRYEYKLAATLSPLQVGDIVAFSKDWDYERDYKRYVVTSIHPTSVQNFKKDPLARQLQEKSPFDIGVIVRIIGLRKNTLEISRQGSEMIYVGLTPYKKIGEYVGDLWESIKKAGVYKRAATLQRHKVKTKKDCLIS